MRTVYSAFGLVMYRDMAVFELDPSAKYDIYQYEDQLAPRLGTAGDLLINLWYRWDTGWYLKIAAFGYAPDDGSIIFPPLYPLLIRLAAPLSGGNYLIAAIVLANAACIAFLLLFFELARQVLGTEALAWRAAIYLTLFPTAFYLYAAYAESLYLAFALATWLLALRGRWLWVGVMGGLLSLTRLQGAAIVPPLLWLVIAGPSPIGLTDQVGQVRRLLPALRTRSHWQAVWERARRGAWIALLVPVLAYMGNNLWLEQAGLGSVSDAYVRYWDMRVVMPWTGIVRLAQQMLSVRIGPDLVIILAMLIFALAVSAAGLFLLNPSFSLYSWGTLGTIFMRDYVFPMSGFPRYFLTLFPHFFLLARWAERRRWLHWALIAVFFALQLLFLWLFLGWGWVA